MNCIGKISLRHFRYPLSFFSILIFTILFISPVHAENPQIKYNATTGTLSVIAADVSLSKLMSKISQLTGTKVTVAENAEQTVSLNTEKQPVEKALKSLTRTYHLNHMFIHHTKDGQTELKEMKILPQEKISDTGLSEKTDLNVEGITNSNTASTDKKEMEAIEKRRIFIEERKKGKIIAFKEKHLKSNDQCQDEKESKLTEKNKFKVFTPEERREEKRKSLQIKHESKFPEPQQSPDIEELKKSSRPSHRSFFSTVGGPEKD
jgi:type II secretory pathway component GspD/PulD (secretin)